ncbi:S-adenosyl-L-methionine-dependent methyltransferase [Terfezia claveryi]|nr:S-adenosyl-L-methionine-dependent methyltransferase [Terfezia claveryi]
MGNKTPTTPTQPRPKGFPHSTSTRLKRPPIAAPIPPTADFKSKARSKVPFVLTGLAVFTITAYGTQLYVSWKNIPEPSAQVSQVESQGNVSHVYDRIAKDYDSNIKLSEFWMGMPLLRRLLARKLEGHVLEVSAGTGRNIKYYPVNRCGSITLVDSSSSMLDQARKNFRGSAFANAEAPIPSPAGQGYDRVVQTMGLCSHHSPVQLLHNLESLCKKDGGKIILLEHGRSHYDWLNKILDYGAPKHAETWGCWWNRDIQGILKESGLNVEKISRYHFGTTYWIEATPRQQERSE